MESFLESFSRHRGDEIMNRANISEISKKKKMCRRPAHCVCLHRDTNKKKGNLSRRYRHRGPPKTNARRIPAAVSPKLLVSEELTPPLEEMYTHTHTRTCGWRARVSRREVIAEKKR